MTTMNFKQLIMFGHMKFIFVTSKLSMKQKLGFVS
jgi:hypothetical protein